MRRALMLGVTLAAGWLLSGAHAVAGDEPAEGFGVNNGGSGGKEIRVSSASQMKQALRQSKAYIRCSGDIMLTSANTSKASNITIDGQGQATLWGKPGNHYLKIIEFYGQNIVIKNIRIRNGGDNLSFKAPASKIFISHVTTSAGNDDGMSLSYGTRNVTVQYTAFFGNSRSCFIKYKAPSNMSLHHNWFKGQWIRGPLISGAKMIDFRNNLVEDWGMWGSRFEAGATGNAINNMHILTGRTAGKSNGALFLYKGGGPACFRGNVGKGCKPQTTKTAEMPCPSVTTHSAAEAERIVRGRAGCLPRDGVDQAYASGTKWPTVGDGRPWMIKAGPGDSVDWAAYGSSQSGGEAPAYTGGGTKSSGRGSSSSSSSYSSEPGNSPPVFTTNRIPTQTLTLGGRRSSSSFYVRAKDPDGDKFTIEASGMPPGATFDKRRYRFTYAPRSFPSSMLDSKSRRRRRGKPRVEFDVVFTATDRKGASSSITVKFIIYGAENKAPVISRIGDKSVRAGDTLSFRVRAMDENDAGGELNYSVSKLPYGAKFDSRSGTFTWAVKRNMKPGTYKVTFTVTDPGGLKDSEAITITVTGNKPPVLAPIGAQTVTPGETLTFSVKATDPDGDKLKYLASRLPSGAKFDSRRNTVTWKTRKTDKPKVYKSTFTVIDPSGAKDTEPVTITVVAAAE